MQTQCDKESNAITLKVMNLAKCKRLHPNNDATDIWYQNTIIVVKEMKMLTHTQTNRWRQELMWYQEFQCYLLYKY